MARYVVQVDKAEDLIVEDPELQLELQPGWAIFSGQDGVALVMPAERIRSIQRLDESADPVADGP